MTALDRLLDRLTSLGKPLTDDARARITALDSKPSPQTWNAAYALRLDARQHSTTLCAAVRQIDSRCPPAPTSTHHHDNPARWNGYFPAQLTLRIALNRVAEQVPIVICRSLGDRRPDQPQPPSA
ncbi:hypothetical protein [Lentzea sp. NPDC059081]|uniref:hypothetical protein n=1 Tax=Lentzea sp. NPDC059081 TaxID=3346719 RepID=UPI0036C131ED